MTRREAEANGYCKHCAAYLDTWMCGITLPPEKKHNLCILPEEVAKRWKGEWGLEGETQRSPSRQSFGDTDLMKKKRGRKAKRYLK